MPKSIVARLQTIKQKITDAEKRYNREPGSVKLIAVSKRQSVEKIEAAIAADQRYFGESYVQEGLEKILSLNNPDLEWHFIGPIQSNKTKDIAENFDWVHSLYKEKIARRLNEQRPDGLPPLNVCIQVNTSFEASKGGILVREVPGLVSIINELPRLKLRGLMTLPAKCDDFNKQREPFHKLKQLINEINNKNMVLDELSMGMSNDLEAAIAEGATMVRVGTDIFGAR